MQYCLIPHHASAIFHRFCISDYHTNPTSQLNTKYTCQCYIAAITTVVGQGVHIFFTCRVKTPLYITPLHPMDMKYAHTRDIPTHTIYIHAPSLINQLDITVGGFISATQHYLQVTVRGLPSNPSMIYSSIQQVADTTINRIGISKTA